MIQGEDGSLLDVLADENQISPDSSLLVESLQEEIRRALSTLTTRESDVLSLYYGLGNHDPLTLEELGEKFGLTRERVRQIKEKATRRLKGASRSRALKSYL
jgi:RNA polymerase primary sigma factor